jgi:hypothetical protein
MQRSRTVEELANGPHRRAPLGGVRAAYPQGHVICASQHKSGAKKIRRRYERRDSYCIGPDRGGADRRKPIAWDGSDRWYYVDERIGFHVLTARATRDAVPAFLRLQREELGGNRPPWWRDATGERSRTGPGVWDRVGIALHELSMKIGAYEGLIRLLAGEVAAEAVRPGRPLPPKSLHEPRVWFVAPFLDRWHDVFWPIRHAPPVCVQFTPPKEPAWLDGLDWPMLAL